MPPFNTRIFEGVTETVPTYRSLMIYFDPRRMAAETSSQRSQSSRILRSPHERRRNGGTSRPAMTSRMTRTSPKSRLFSVCRARKSSICIRARATVSICMASRRDLFFSAGFHQTYDPRRAVPRFPAPPGSLLIAGGQALIASCAMPTGWYGIGRTPVKVFDPRRAKIFLAGIGDEICFEWIDGEAFDALSLAAEGGALGTLGERLDEL